MQPLFQHEHPLLILPDCMHDHEQAWEDLYGRWASEAQQHPVGCVHVSFLLRTCPSSHFLLIAH
jgi:hypothetical protein